MTFLTTLLAFLVALAILIVIHELGHFCVARMCGVKVLRFSVGFGNPIFTLRMGADRTEWTIAAWPLGGYVKMLDEREGPVDPSELPRAFNQQTVWRRIAIVLAGPLANLALAVVIYWCILIVGVVENKPKIAPPRTELNCRHERLAGGRDCDARERVSHCELAGLALAVDETRDGSRGRKTRNTKSAK